ncbi:MAG: hypothetical protein ACREJO_00580 [Phycisphaerales bacterium]
MIDHGPISPSRRCHMGSLSLLVLVAMTLSAGVSARQWAVVDHARPSLPTERQVTYHQTQTVQTQRARQETRPDVVEAVQRISFRTQSLRPLFARSLVAAAPMPVRVGLLDLPPPGVA